MYPVENPAKVNRTVPYHAVKKPIRAPPLAQMKEADKIPFLNAPISSGSLFGPAVEGFA